MKKLLPIFMVSILVLGGFGTAAIPNEKKIQDRPVIPTNQALEIKVKGGFLGYNVKVTNVGNESVTGNLSIKIITDAWILLANEELEKTISLVDFEPDRFMEFNLRPLYGFGPAEIKTIIELENISKNVTANGFILFIYVSCDVFSIPLT